MRKNNFLISLMVVICILSCKEKKNDTGVQRTVTSFFEGMYDRNFTKARAHATPESDEIISFLAQLAGTTPQPPNEVQPKISVSDVQIVHDTIATAMVKAEDQPHSIKMTVKKRANEWKVAFDARSLAIMLGQDPDGVEQEMLVPHNDSLDVNVQSLAPDSIL